MSKRSTFINNYWLYKRMQCPGFLRAAHTTRFRPNMCYTCKDVSTAWPYLSPPESSGCACRLCLKGAIVREDRLNRETLRLLDDRERQDSESFKSLDDLLNACRTTPSWLAHLSSQTESFTIICNGKWSSLSQKFTNLQVEIDEKLERMAIMDKTY